MLFKRALLAAAAAVTLGLGLASAGAQATTISFTIASISTHGVTGSGFIVAGAVATESTINVQLQGLHAGGVHLVSQYHGTSCSSYDAAPEFVFNTVTADSQGKAAALITVKKPFANWPNRPHFFIVHESASPTSAAISCGMIVAAAAPPAQATTVAPPPTSAPAPGAPRAGTGLAAENPGTLDWFPLAVAGISIAISAGVVADRLRRRAVRASRP